MHSFVMHRKVDVFALRASYDRHTRQHHPYFSDNDATIDTVREFGIVFFPWRALIVLGVVGVVIGTSMAFVVDANARCHVGDNAFVRHMPFVNTIRRHHTAHHNMGTMMHFNMNLTFPIADWFLDTSDLDRSSATSSTATATNTSSPP